MQHPDNARLALLLLAASVACSAHAVAQDAPSEEAIAEARRHFEEGEALFQSDSYAHAEAEFRRAYELMAGHPRRALVLVNVARSIEEQPGREREALETYEQMLAETEGSSDAAIEEGRTTARARIAQLRARLEARRQGDGATSSQDGQAETSPTDSSISPVGPILLAAGGAVLLAGTITGGVALAERDSLLARCVGRSCPPDAEDQAATVSGLALATDVLLFGGAAIAVVGLVLTLILREEEVPARASAVCRHHGCVGALEGTW